MPWGAQTEDNLDIQRAQESWTRITSAYRELRSGFWIPRGADPQDCKRFFRVLVVDDEEIARRNLEHVLIKEGYQVTTAGTGLDAVKLVHAHPFDVVLTDLKWNVWMGWRCWPMPGEPTRRPR